MKNIVLFNLQKYITEEDLRERLDEEQVQYCLEKMKRIDPKKMKDVDEEIPEDAYDYEKFAESEVELRKLNLKAMATSLIWHRRSQAQVQVAWKWICYVFMVTLLSKNVNY